MSFEVSGSTVTDSTEVTYGSASDVAAHIPMYANEDMTFTSATSPTLSVVEEWLWDLTGAVNYELELYDMSTPASGFLGRRLKTFVNQEVAAQVRHVYRLGQAGPNESDGEDSARNLLTNIDDVTDLISRHNNSVDFSIKRNDITYNDPYTRTSASANEWSRI